jgi:hypothetical protein
MEDMTKQTRDEILAQWAVIKADYAACCKYLDEGKTETPEMHRRRLYIWEMREEFFKRTLLDAMPEIEMMLMQPPLPYNPANDAALIAEDILNPILYASKQKRKTKPEV